MRRGTLLLVAVMAVLVLAGAGAVYAQIAPQPVTPPICGDMAAYDHNNDGRLDGRDFDLWVVTVHEGSESCRLDGPASGCPPWVDVNGDGTVSVADLDAMHSFMMWCVYPPRITAPWPAR